MSEAPQIILPRLDRSKAPDKYKVFEVEWRGCWHFNIDGAVKDGRMGSCKSSPDGALGEAWLDFEHYNDPPGLETFNEPEGPPGGVWMIQTLDKSGYFADYRSQPEARKDAWKHYWRLVRLYDKGLAHRGRGWVALNPWPRMLLWSEADIAAVEAWIMGDGDLPEALELPEESGEAIPVLADASEPERSFKRLAERLTVEPGFHATSWVSGPDVVRTAGAFDPAGSPWRVWQLRHEGQEQPHTKVIKGPSEIIVTGDLSAFVFESEIIVTGDLSAFVFERPSGGLPLSFWNGGLTYAAEKATAGQVHEYSAVAARRDLMAAIDRRVEDEEMSPELASAIKHEAEDLDFDSEEKVHDFYWAKVDTDRGDYPYLGQIYTSRFLWALACIKAVFDHDETAPEATC